MADPERKINGKPFGKLLNRYADIAVERERLAPSETFAHRQIFSMLAALNEYEEQVEARLAALEAKLG